MAEGEAPVPHHGRVRLVRQHPVQQNRKDFSLHLYIAGIRKKKKKGLYYEVGNGHFQAHSREYPVQCDPNTDPRHALGKVEIS